MPHVLRMNAPLLSQSLASLTRGSLGSGSEQAQNSSFEERLGSALRVASGGQNLNNRLRPENLLTDAAIFSQGVDNTSSAFDSYAEAARASNALNGIVAEIQALAEYASNGAVAGDLRLALHEEAQALVTEYSRVLGASRYNNSSLVDGTTSSLAVQGGYERSTLAATDLTQDFAELVETTIETTVPSDGSFSSGTFQATGALSIDAIQRGNLTLDTADFNEDGNVDIVNIQTGPNELQVSFGAGNGSFSSNFSLDAGATDALTRVFSVRAGDVNNDGNQDIIASNTFEANNLRVFLGNGDGSFKASVSYSSGTVSRISEVADLNSDGYDDIVLSRSDLGVMLSNGDGTFTSVVTYNAGGGTGFESVTGDFTGDGILDIAVNDNSSGVSIWRGNGSGGFSQTDLEVGSVESIAAADFNNDGTLDVIGTNSSDGVILFTGVGNGTLNTRVTISPAGTYTAAGYGDSIVAGDFNDDGNSDFAYTLYEDDSILVRLGNGNGSFKAEVTYTSTSVVGLALADMDEDGATDIISLRQGGNGIRVFEGTPSTTSSSTEITDGSIDLMTISAAETAYAVTAAIGDDVSAGAATLAAGLSRLANNAVQLGAQADNSQAASLGANSSTSTRYSAISKAFGAYALSRSILDDQAPSPQDPYSLLNKIGTG